MAENAAEPTLVDIEDNPRPAGGEAGWLYLSRGKVWLRAAYWPAAVDEPQGTVILATGRAEFIEKYYETIEDLLARGFAVATFDWRGQGGSSRLLRNPAKGHVASFDDYVDDLEAAVAGAALRGLPRPFYLLAHSMGATVALLGASRLAGQIERMVLSAPLIEFADKRASSRWAKTVGGLAAGIGLARRTVRPGRGPAPQDMPFDGNPVTSDQRRFARTQAVLRAEPRLGLGAPTIRWYAAANRATRDLAEPGYGEEIKIPTLVVACGTDEVVSVRAIERFAKTLRSGGRVLIPGARHEILMERTAFRTLFWAAFDAFVPGSDLRLATDIAPPKVKIAPPAKAGGAPAAVGALLAPAATEAEDAEGSTVDSATAEAPSPETASSTQVAEAVEAGKALETNETAPGREPSAEAQPASNGETGTEAPVALAPAAPEAAETERQRFSLFRRRKRVDPAAQNPSDTPPADDRDDAPQADGTAPPPDAPATAAGSEATGEPARPSDPDRASAEAALAAATSLVAEATRGEAPAEKTNEGVQARTGGAGDTKSEAGPDASAAPAEAVAPAAAETPSADGKRNGRVGRLFRRRFNGSDAESDAETRAAPPPEAAPASVTPDAAPPMNDAPADHTASEEAASKEVEPGMSRPEPPAVRDDAAATTATITVATGARAAGDAAPADDADTSAKATEPGSAERATAPDTGIGQPRRPIGEAARPTPRPVKRGRGKPAKR